MSQFVGAEMMATEVGHHPRGRWRRSPSSPTSGRSRPGPKAGSSGRSLPLNGSRPRRRARVSPNLDKIRSLKTLTPDGRITAACASQISDGSAALLIAGEQAMKDARPHASGAHPPHQRARRRSDHDAVGADPGHQAGLREDRHDARRHRSRRDQRGVRPGRAGVDEGDRASTTPRSTSTAARSPSGIRSAPPVAG